ncbi:MAG: GHKL domain-containing protein [Sphingobacteriaceae bacterium]|nr:GHKL domain-containing protein [Sphingobacteriaceae bacterium]
MNKLVIDFEQLFLSLPGLYLILSPDLTILSSSEAYNLASMTKRDEIIGKKLFDVFPDNSEDLTADGVSNLSASLQSVLKNKMPHTMAIQKYDIRRPDGVFEVRYWSPINIPFLDQHNEVACIIHRVQDVTEFVIIQSQQQEAEQLTRGLQTKLSEMEIEIITRAKEIQKLNTELEAKVATRTATLQQSKIELEAQAKKLKTQNKELEQFAYIASHDLQEPLRTLISFASLFEEEFKGKLNEDAETYLNFIIHSSKRMQQLVQGLLDYSRIGKEVSLKPVNCNEIINEVMDDMAASINESAAKISVQPLPELTGNPIEMRQLFQNLLSNALKFRKKDTSPQISITAEQQTSNWLFSIKDNGIGIAEADKDKIFTIFKRLHNRDEYEGTGIGLSHCRKIVEQHGGNIWIDSQPGLGSTFHFTIQNKS